MADPGSMRQRNLLDVLRSIDDNGDATAAMISEQTGLSAATISRALSTLKRRNLVTQPGKGCGELGRRADLFRLNTRYGFHLYYFFFGRTMYGSLTDFGGTQKAASQTDLPQSCDLTGLLDAMQQISTELLRLHHPAEGHLLTVSVSISGIIDHRGIVSRVPTFPNLEGCHLSESIQHTFQLPCFVYNQAKLSAVGEYFLAPSGTQSLAYIEINAESGIGAGLVLGGQLYEGAGCRAGEIGDMVIGLPTGINKQQKEGILEQQAGLSSIFRHVQLLLESGGAKKLAALISRTPQPLNLHLLEKAASSMDVDVFHVLNQAVQLWAASIVNLIAVIAPDRIIVGGAVTEENTLLSQLLVRHVNELYHSPVTIHPAKKNSRSHQIGAFYFSKRYILEQIVRDIVDHS